MSLFAIADPHLSFNTSKPMDVFRGWADYTVRLEKNWRALVGPEDTVVIAGDISWGMDLREAAADLAFIDRLPGRKILLKGNHDYWWTTRKKMDDFLREQGLSTLHILHNDAYATGNVAVCGSRGWFFDAGDAADQKVLLREAGRLRTSIQAAKKTGLEPVAFLHYPPVCGDQVCEEIFSVLREEGIRRCYYGHLHGPGIRHAFQGEKDGVRLRLISCDALAFCPLLVC